MSLEKGWCVWITGLPGSGKSTIAALVVKRLRVLGIHAQVVSIDMVRQFATPHPAYTDTERDIVYGALVFAAKTLTDNRVNVIIDATGNRRRYRDHARQAIRHYIEVYVACPLRVCMQREAKRKNRHLAPAHIYEKAAADQSSTVPGVGAPYEEPRNPEVKVDSSRLSAEGAADTIVVAVQRHFV
jgi:adenylylsulfate kinase